MIMTVRPAHGKLYADRRNYADKDLCCCKYRKIILSAVTPVFDEKDTVVGVVGIDVGLDTVMNMMGNYTIGANGYSMLLTSDGTFVYHPNADLIDTMIQDMNISDSVSTAISNQSEQLLKYKVNGEQKWKTARSRWHRCVRQWTNSGILETGCRCHQGN